MKKLLLSAVVAATAAMVATAALAAPNAIVTRDSDVYKTRTGNQVVNEVEEDELVEVLECRGNRCKVKIPGPDGWMRSNRLEELDDFDDDDDDETDDTIKFGITIGPGGPGITIGSGEPTSGPRVCIFQHPNYGGAQRCFAPGTSVPNFEIIGWNDAMSSVRVYGGAWARMCEHANGGGVCYEFATNASSVVGFDEMASSITVY